MNSPDAISDGTVEPEQSSSNSPAARTIEPDDLDRQIIAMLQVDGRCSNREIARQLDVPEATVRYRVRRLTESGLLRITALIEPEQLGYHLTSVISIQTQTDKVEEVADKLVAYPEVMCLIITTGVYDIVFTAAFQDQAGLYEFLTNHLSRIPGIVRSDSAVGLRVAKRDYEWVSGLTAAVSATSKGR